MKKALVIALSVILLGAAALSAAPTSDPLVTKNISDTKNIWRQGHSPNPWAQANPEDNVDVIGIPDFDVALNELKYSGYDGALHSIMFEYDAAPSYSNLMLPGDLFLDFIDTGFGNWDYVITTPYRGSSSGYADSVINGAQTWDVYDLTSSPLDYRADSGQFQLSNNSLRRDGGDWSGYNIRGKHPWRLASVPTSGDIGDAAFSGWLDQGTDLQATFTFDDEVIDLGTPGQTFGLIIGFTVNCANDVIWEDVSGTLVQIPEPASLAIWGGATGLGLGALALRRRRRKHARAGWSDDNRQQILAVVERGRA